MHRQSTVSLQSAASFASHGLDERNYTQAFA